VVTYHVVVRDEVAVVFQGDVDASNDSGHGRHRLKADIEKMFLEFGPAYRVEILLASVASRPEVLLHELKTVLTGLEGNATKEL
jgi:hypothetical protein